MRVIAIETGFDGVAVRNTGDEFDMPDDVFERRPRLNEKGEPIAGQFYEPPSWFEPVDRSAREKVDADRKAIRKTNRVPAIDPLRQQAEATAEGRLRAQAEEEVRQQNLQRDEEETRKAVDKRFSELKNRSGRRLTSEEQARAEQERQAAAKKAADDAAKNP